MMTKLTSFNPYTGEPLGSVEVDSYESVILKIEHLKRINFNRTSIVKRMELLKKLGYKIVEKHKKIAELIVREQGKPMVEAKGVEILAVVDSIFFLAENLGKFLSEQKIKHYTPFFSHKEGFLRYEPYGVALVISPWNYPFAIPMIDIALSLAAGNSVLFKPSSLTPFVGKEIGKLCKEVGLPVEVVVMKGKEIEKVIEKVDLVVFTGSTEIGKRISTIGSNNLKKLILELGGKDPMIVLDDVNIDRAVAGCIWGSLVNAGQTCAAIERVYVHSSIYDDFIQLLIEKIKYVKTGDPLLIGTDMGPIVSEPQINSIKFHIKDAINKGATVVYGGKRDGFILIPTVLINVDHGMLLMREETFGPVIPVKVFEKEEEVIDMANDSIYGLTASIWTGDRERGIRMAKRIEAATVTINDHGYSFGEPSVFWGGFKMSGIGLSHGVHGIKEMSRLKFISVDDDSFNEEIWWYPYDQKKYKLFNDGIDFMFGESFIRRAETLLKNVDLVNKMRIKNLLSVAKRFIRRVK